MSEEVPRRHAGTSRLLARGVKGIGGYMAPCPARCVGLLPRRTSFSRVYGTTYCLHWHDAASAKAAGGIRSRACRSPTGKAGRHRRLDSVRVCTPWTLDGLAPPSSSLDLPASQRSTPKPSRVWRPYVGRPSYLTKIVRSGAWAEAPVFFSLVRLDPVCHEHAPQRPIVTSTSST